MAKHVRKVNGPGLPRACLEELNPIEPPGHPRYWPAAPEGYRFIGCLNRDTWVFECLSCYSNAYQDTAKFKPNCECAMRNPVDPPLYPVGGSPDMNQEHWAHHLSKLVAELIADCPPARCSPFAPFKHRATSLELKVSAGFSRSLFKPRRGGITVAILEHALEQVDLAEEMYEQELSLYGLNYHMVHVDPENPLSPPVGFPLKIIRQKLNAALGVFQRAKTELVHLPEGAIEQIRHSAAEAEMAATPRPAPKEEDKRKPSPFPPAKPLSKPPKVKLSPIMEAWRRTEGKSELEILRRIAPTRLRDKFMAHIDSIYGGRQFHNIAYLIRMFQRFPLYKWDDPLPASMAVFFHAAVNPTELDFRANALSGRKYVSGMWRYYKPRKVSVLIDSLGHLGYARTADEMRLASLYALSLWDHPEHSIDYNARFLGESPLPMMNAMANRIDYLNKVLKVADIIIHAEMLEPVTANIKALISMMTRDMNAWRPQ